jgi:hypothetical protein
MRKPSIDKFSSGEGGAKDQASWPEPSIGKSNSAVARVYFTIQEPDFLPTPTELLRGLRLSQEKEGLCVLLPLPLFSALQAATPQLPRPDYGYRGGSMNVEFPTN